MSTENVELKVANPEFTTIVHQCLLNPKMVKLYEYLTSNKIPGLEEGGDLDAHSREMMEFCQIVREIVWDSVHPNEPITIRLN